MTDLTPVASLDPVVQLETNTLALGGTGNPMNQQAQALLNRDAFRGQQIAEKAASADLADDTDDALGSSLIGYNLSAIALAVGRSLHNKIAEIEVSITDFGAEPSPFDSSAAFTAALDFLITLPNGGVLTVPPGTWINNNSRLIDTDHIMIRGAGSADTTIQRTDATTGYMFLWANGGNTEGGGITGCRLVGVDTTASGAGLGFGTIVNFANGFTVDDVICERWGQYGCQIFNGNDWSVTRLRIKVHGLTSGAISSCIGFGVFPRIASSGGYINGVMSNISAECVANASANTAAIKLQTHQHLRASNLHGINGSELCVSIDSITGYVRGLLVDAQPGRTGLKPGNSNPAHSFSGQEFVIDGVEIRCPDGATVFGLNMSGDGTNHSLTGCTISNVKAPTVTAQYLNYAAYKDCLFESWDFGEIRFANVLASTLVSAAISTGNTLRNIRSNGLTGGICALEVTNSVIEGCGSYKTRGAATAHTVYLYGDSNEVNNPISIGAGALNCFTVVGDSNTFRYPIIRGSTGRTLNVQSGSDANTFIGWPRIGTGVNDLGLGNSCIQPPLTGTDVGDAGFTLFPHNSPTTTIFATPLTANRAINLATTGAYAGLRLRVVRKASATGAFSVNVGTGPLKALSSAGQWCEVEYDGTAWLLSAFGSL